MASSLDYLLRPQSVAVIGASRKRGTVGAELFRNLLTSGFHGAVYPVNPTTKVVQAVRAYATVLDIPDEVDLAVIVVPKQHVLGAVEDCAKKGIKGIIVISAGFGEAGPEGKALQDQVLRVVRANRMRMVGPNCLGILNTDPEVRLNATFAPVAPTAGHVAFSSQSGALGVAILDHAHHLGIGIRQFVSVGNKADVTGNDLLEYWERDPDTHVILLYLESFGNPRRFMQLARRIARTKPIIVVKSGRTAAGARAASSHTGSLAGLDVAVDALLGQAGVIRTNTIEELFDVAVLVANQPIAKGRRVAILTNAGGPAIMCSDACESRGLEVTQLSPDTEEALKSMLPPEASVKNPVDMLASVEPLLYEKAVRLLLADPKVDSVIVLFVPPMVTEASDVAEAVARGAQGHTKPVLTSFLGTHTIPDALKALRAGRFPNYSFPEAAARALARTVRYGEWLRQPAGIPTEPDVAVQQQARQLLQQSASGEAVSGEAVSEGRWLSPPEVQELLQLYGIRMPKAAVAASAEEAASKAEDIGFPVVVKLLSESITHKSDVGGVVLGLKSKAAVSAAFTEMQEKLAARGLASQMQGVLVQEQLTEGLETFIGVTLDAKFGPLVAFGIGGVNIEVWRDVVFRVHPLTDIDARQMLEQIRATKLLDGFRGAPAADRPALADALLRVSRLVGDLPEVLEMDINPLFALSPGKGVVAVDARIRVRG